jgi:hypothetical protein
LHKVRFGRPIARVLIFPLRFLRRRKSRASWPSPTRTGTSASTTPGGASPPDPRP